MGVGDCDCGLVGRQSGEHDARGLLVKLESRRSCSRAAYLSLLSSRERLWLKLIPERVRDTSIDLASIRKILAIVSVDNRGNFLRKSLCCQRCCCLKEAFDGGVGVE